MRARLFLAFLPLLTPFLGAGPAAAQAAQPLDRLLPQIRRDHPGQFLDAEGFNSGGSPHYHLKWLTPDGRVLWLDADARTGRVVGQSPGRDGFDGPRYRAPDNAYGGAQDRRDEGRSQADPRYDNSRQYRGDPYSNYGRQYGNGRVGGGQQGGPSGGGQRFNNGGGGYGNRNSGGGGRDRNGR
jgi:hypothetical protein